MSLIGPPGFVGWHPPFLLSSNVGWNYHQRSRFGKYVTHSSQHESSFSPRNTISGGIPCLNKPKRPRLWFFFPIFSWWTLHRCCLNSGIFSVYQAPLCSSNPVTAGFNGDPGFFNGLSRLVSIWKSLKFPFRQTPEKNDPRPLKKAQTFAEGSSPVLGSNSPDLDHGDHLHPRLMSLSDILWPSEMFSWCRSMWSFCCVELNRYCIWYMIW